MNRSSPPPVPTGADVALATRDCKDLLSSVVEWGWDVPVPELDWTVAQVVAHAAETCLWYAIDLAAGGKDLQSVEHRVKPDSPPHDLVDTLVAYATVVARVVDGAPPDSRGFHPAGLADPSGFAAMACDELLIHTDDAARGLGVEFAPSRELCDRTLRRLFPWAPSGVDPWDGLRWANGRIELPGHRRLPAGWRWHCAPLDEWDGTVPAGITNRN
jgi:uncharacterized protein (TIGR03083 family)